MNALFYKCVYYLLQIVSVLVKNEGYHYLSARIKYHVEKVQRRHPGPSVLRQFVHV